MRVSLFIDGFNFCYRLYRGEPKRCPPAHTWLNPVLPGDALCRHQRIDGSIVRVHYCSAPALPGYRDPDQPTRQQHYFRALSGIPEVTITLGQHTSGPKCVQTIGPNGRDGVGAPFRALVREEKGADVNLATFLVRDAALDEFDLAFVLSNDSDLENAVRIAVQDFGKDVCVVSPKINGTKGNKPRVTNRLKGVATRVFVLDATLLARCRLPDPAPDATGAMVTCPASWKERPALPDVSVA